MYHIITQNYKYVVSSFFFFFFFFFFVVVVVVVDVNQIATLQSKN